MAACHLRFAFAGALLLACGGQSGAVGVSNGAPTKSAPVTQQDAGAKKVTTWPMPKDYRASLKKIASGEVSRGHDPDRYTYDLYRRGEAPGDLFVMEHFALDNGQLVFVYTMSRARPGAPWTYGAMTNPERGKELPPSATALALPDPTCPHCHSEAPHDGVFTH